MPVMKMEISSVFPQARDWNSDKWPDMVSVQGFFADGSQWDLGTKKGNLQQRIDTMKALVGKEGDFDLEDKGEYQGVKQYKLKSWPGKSESQGGGGGGGRNWQPAYTQTQEGFLAEQEAMMRRTAAMQAVQWGERGPIADILKTADALYNWLMATQGSVSAPKPQQVQNVSSAPTAPQTPNTGQIQASGEVWEGPGQCPRCHAPANSRHGSKCLVKSEYRPEDDPFID